MRTFNVAFLLVVITAAAVIIGHGSARRIVGGTFAEEKQYPYHVALFENGTFSCGGSIIDTKWILTAAHCVVEHDGSSIPLAMLKVLAGTTHLCKGGQYLELEKVFPHESYGKEGHAHDIALLKLKKAIVYDDTMQKIELNKEAISEGTNVTITGHGRTGTFEPHSELLKVNTMKTTSDKECHEESGVKSDGLLCINNVVENGICIGDSGGPAVYGKKQVGVANFVLNRCGSAKPDGFAKVSFYYDWIQKTMKK